MAYFHYLPRKPDDEFTPGEFTQDQMDAMQIPMDRRDKCGNYYVEFKKCIMVTHQNNNGVLKWKRTAKANCGYYQDHWNFCREKFFTEIGLSTRATGL